LFQPGDVISYLDMCQEEGVNLQRGMNYRLHHGYSVILMSLRKNAPYADSIEEDGHILIYEGHDVVRSDNNVNPKSADQPMRNPSATLTQNGLFYEAAQRYKNGKGKVEKVRVYEKIRAGIWAYNGLFDLVDAWQEASGFRRVFKFKLEMPISQNEFVGKTVDIEHNRMIPSSVKLEVWKRDKGRCVECGSTDNLHFDHIIPFSKGGSSLVPENIQLLCARHNIAKRDNIS
jgi:hypothetical protein